MDEQPMYIAVGKKKKAIESNKPKPTAQAVEKKYPPELE